MFGASNYNYEHFSRDLLREFMDGKVSGPQAGDYAPDFTADSLDGEPVRLRDLRDRNVLLIFGSATCPMTAATMGELNALAEELKDDVAFLFVYVREAHPGDRLPAHESEANKIDAARLLREEEAIAMPVLVDDLRGTVHRKYSVLPHSAFLIDKSGRIAFRSLWSNPDALAAAIDDLLALQDAEGSDHAVVRDGEDPSMPLSYAMLRSHRALHRGGRQAVKDFYTAVGRDSGSLRRNKSLLTNPARVFSIAALTAAVLAGGIYAGFELRRRRLGIRRNPYRAYEKEKVRDTETGEDYGAVGI